jgi:hypothetical protein
MSDNKSKEVLDLVSKIKGPVEEFCPKGTEGEKAVVVFAMDEHGMAGALHGSANMVANLIYNICQNDPNFGDIVVAVAKQYTMDKIKIMTATKSGKGKNGKTLLN